MEKSLPSLFNFIRAYGIHHDELPSIHNLITNLWDMNMTQMIMVLHQFHALINTKSLDHSIYKTEDSDQDSEEDFEGEP